MICSRCRTEIQGSVCPHCGLEGDAEKTIQRSIPFESRLGNDREVLPGDMPDSGPENQASRPPVLRNSLRVASTSRPVPRRPRISRSRAAPERSLFPDGFSGTGGRGEKKIVTVTRKASSARSLVDKPLIRMPAGSRPAQVPKQQELRLEASPPQSGSAGAEETTPPSPEIPSEIILSRLLSGIVDASLSILTGFLFSWTACLILNLGFLSVTTLSLGGACSLGFYFLSSCFFLISCGQTPGMYLTELRLIAEEGPEAVPAHAILFRVLLFPAVAASLVGLCLSLFDPGRRCLHDRLTHTRVVPNDF